MTNLSSVDDDFAAFEQQWLVWPKSIDVSLWQPLSLRVITMIAICGAL